MTSHLGERGATAGDGHEASSALGTEDRPSVDQISSRCRIWREGGARTTRAPGTRYPGVEANPSDLFGCRVSGGWRSFRRRNRRRTGSRAMGFGRRRSREEMADFEEAHAPWAVGPSDSVKGTQSCNGEYTNNTAAEEDAHRSADAAQGGAQSSQAQRLSARAVMNPKRHGTFGVVATCVCDHPSIGKFPRFYITFLCIVAWVCSSTHPGRHWPACFDQKCGNTGEGPLTALELPEAPGMSLTPTQEFMTCDMIKRKTREKRGPDEICRACGSTLARRQQGQKCRKHLVWAWNTACGRDVVDLQCCRMSGVASRESQTQSCPQGLGRSAVDVQIAAAQSDLQTLSERVAYRAAFLVVPAAMAAVPVEVENGQPMQVDLATPSACQGHRAVRCSIGPRRGCWSWRRHCRRCGPSGTSRGA